jgi:hypothetical protein
MGPILSLGEIFGDIFTSLPQQASFPKNPSRVFMNSAEEVRIFFLVYIISHFTSFYT